MRVIIKRGCHKLKNLLDINTYETYELLLMQCVNHLCSKRNIMYVE